MRNFTVNITKTNDKKIENSHRINNINATIFYIVNKIITIERTTSAPIDHGIFFYFKCIKMWKYTDKK